MPEEESTDKTDNKTRDDLPPPTTVNHHLDRAFSVQLPVSPLKSKAKKSTSTSLLLTRWLGNPKSHSLVPEDAGGSPASWTSEDRCMDYGTPPPIEEPHCYSMGISESSTVEEGSSPVQINHEYIKSLLTDHARSQGSRLQLLEDLETSKINAQNLANISKTLKLGEINVMLLYASFLGQADLVTQLHAHGADLNHSEQELGLTALHLCAFSNCLAGVRYILSQEIKISSRKPHTPFHYAAFGNARDVARSFRDLGWSQDSPLGEETVLHAAARSNASEVLQLLAPNNPYVNRLDSWGYAPLHHVAERGESACLKILIDSGAMLDVSTRKGDTALHLAAEAGMVDNLELLLVRGANAVIRNRRGQTPLHLAARTHCLDCVEVLLQRGATDPNVEDHDGRTPLHMALGRSLLAYDVTDLLISWKATVNKADKYGYTPLHVAALNELSQCVDLLIEHGADLSARTKGGTSALSIILRKTPTSLNVFKHRLNASISLHQHGSAAGEVEMRLDFHPLLQHQQQGEIGYLGTFVKEGYKEILEHPLCQSFLHLKWQKIRKYYVGRLIFYLIYVLVLTSWVITALAHNCYNESHGHLDAKPLCANSTGLNGFIYKHPVVLDVEWYALVALTVSEGLRKLAGILTYSSIRQFFTQAENLVEWCVILSAFATAFVFTGKTYTWQSHVGAFAVLCGWSNLMLMIGQLPMFGAYVAMFTSVQAQVFKLLLAYACLLVGFTASFCVIFPRSKSFRSPHTGLIKVLVMMTGELDFEELFFPDAEEGGRVDVNGTSWILLQVSAQLSFVLFLLFVTIVLMNLLVGIAVHDIKGLQKTAGLAKLVRQTKLICDLETALFLGLLPNHVMRLLRWTALVLPSPLRAVLTVRPLNPREKRLPSEVLRTAYRVARERKGYTSSSTFLGKRRNTFYNSYPKSEISESRRTYRVDEELLAMEEATRLREEVSELKNVCESNNKLIQELLKSLTLIK